MGARNKKNVLECEKCGWHVTCGEFYKSYTGESMLPGSVTDMFEEYLVRFPKARTPTEKLLLIDWLIHQFHVMQGVAGKPVGQNVVQGTGDQVRELIETLAYGPGNTEGLTPSRIGARPTTIRSAVQAAPFAQPGAGDCSAAWYPGTAHDV